MKFRIISFWSWFVLANLIVGAALRIIWVDDMEYKSDEIYMYERSQNVGVSEPWPTIGMTSGARIANPAMSVWVFVGLAKGFNIKTPTGLGLAVMLLNVTALVLLAFVIYRWISSKEREIWYWALALACVNPMALVFHRKIWAQSTLPFFCVLTLAGWLNRHRFWGAFTWGLLGTVLGQIHMSGFFFAAALVIWTFTFSKQRNINLPGWFFGSVIGVIPMVPWLLNLLTADHKDTRIFETVGVAFWENWFTDPFGLGLAYSLGKKHYEHFSSQPLMSVALFVVAGIAVLVVFFWLYGLFRERKSIVDLLGRRRSSTVTLQNASFWGLGMLFTLAGIYAGKHYLIITFPMQWVWVAHHSFHNASRLVRNTIRSRFPRAQIRRTTVARTLLSILWICQLSISTAYLLYIHDNNGIKGGPYGIAYHAQGSQRDKLCAGYEHDIERRARCLGRVRHRWNHRTLNKARLKKLQQEKQHPSNNASNIDR